MDLAAPLPDSLLQRAPYLSHDGQVICPRCGERGMVKTKHQDGALKSQWRCAAGHYSMLPADLKTEWRVYVTA